MLLDLLVLKVELEVRAQLVLLVLLVLLDLLVHRAKQDQLVLVDQPVLLVEVVPLDLQV